MGTHTVEEHTISQALLPARLPALGYIKIGAKKPSTTSGKGNEFQPPMKLDHFRITKRDRGADGNFELDQAVHEKVGDKPTELMVRLPFDTRGENFYAQMVHYAGRTRKLECDGERCTDLTTQSEGLCSRRAGKSCPCKPYARLSVILEDAPTFGGLYVFRTTSWETANSLQTALRMFEQQFGTLRGLPLKMRLYPAEVRYRDDKGVERTATAYKVALVLRADYETAQAAAVEFHRRSQIARSQILQLSSGTVAELEEIDAEDAADIDQEFFTRGALPAGPSERRAPASKLAEMNREILGGAGGDDEATDEVATLITELRTLMDQAEASEFVLTEKQAEMLDEAIGSEDENNLRASIAWLTDRIAGKREGTENV